MSFAEAGFLPMLFASWRAHRTPMWEGAIWVFITVVYNQGVGAKWLQRIMWFSVVIVQLLFQDSGKHVLAMKAGPQTWMGLCAQGASVMNG
ncbi:hypothetical protein B0T20DRAFT_22195 [Sordaria brevicollis]|uniref:Uncharacterized protein n=1 Tax=Sordaria brevicollis TaxID=83679 RepID=A0AAE0UGH3_SORBR|nr:hypothetical protein B0T20DRAFT_22195 [Sordaria brevicollis]